MLQRKVTLRVAALLEAALNVYFHFPDTFAETITKVNKNLNTLFVLETALTLQLLSKRLDICLDLIIKMTHKCDCMCVCE